MSCPTTDETEIFCKCPRRHVSCDQYCLAFEAPDSNIQELGDAYFHWRYHKFASGCSHGGI